MHLSRPPPLRNLRAFCVAAHHRSFKTAADELFLTPSAVSHQMRELEDALGVRLFERKTRAVELTAAGHSLYDEVAPLLEAIDRSLTRIARRNRRLTLRLMLPPFFATELFIPRIASFCDAHPDIDIQVDTHDPRPVAHPPSADVSVLLTDSVPQGLEVSRLFSLSLVAACAREHADTVARLGSRALREMALIVHRSRPFAWASWAQEVGLEEPEPKNLIELDTMVAVVRAAERGVGIALVPEALCGEWFESGRLVRIFPVELPTHDDYFLVTRVKDAERPEVIAMTGWVLRNCTHLPSMGESAMLRTDSGHTDLQMSAPGGAPARRAAYRER
ncbi:MAG TPA: LysR substrate-binding domain-containing protein [Steroidobacteraceae bacterium]|nr:LysR substrate-binding domain-containing protein [Steroidobacteraceae bacterium]